MHPKSKYSLILISIVFFTRINAQDSLAQFKCFNINKAYFIDYLSFVKPNIPIVPCMGGIYCPDMKAWYFKTNDTILSVEPSYLDSSLIITLSSRNLYEVEKVFPDSSKNPRPLVLTRGYVFYAVPSNFVIGQYFYVVGDNKGFSVCKLFDQKVDTIFRSDSSMIDQLQVLNDSTILFSVNHKIECYPFTNKSYKLSNGKKPYSIFDATKQTIYGFTIDQNGNLYVSLDLGIIKIAKDKTHKLIIGNTVKGKLRFFYKSLYILDAKHGKLDIVSPL